MLPNTKKALLALAFALIPLLATAQTLGELQPPGQPTVIQPQPQGGTTLSLPSAPPGGAMILDPKVLGGANQGGRPLAQTPRGCNPATDKWKCSPPEILDFSADPPQSFSGQRVALNFGISNGEDYKVFIHSRSRPSEELLQEGVIPRGGRVTIMVDPKVTTDFRLEATNPRTGKGSGAERKLTLTVIEPGKLQASGQPAPKGGFAPATPYRPGIPAGTGQPAGNNPKCDATTDIYRCLPPDTPKITFDAEIYDKLTNNKWNMMGQTIYFTVEVGNTKSLEVQHHVKGYTPETINAPANLAPSRQRIRLPLSIRFQRLDLRVVARNPHGEKGDSVSFDVSIQLPAIDNKIWTSGIGANRAVTSADPGEDVSLVLNAIHSADSLLVRLVSSPSSCKALLRNSGNDADEISLAGALSGKPVSARIPVVLQNCGGKPYKVTAELTPRLNGQVFQASKSLSPVLSITGPKLVQPTFMNADLASKPAMGRGRILSGSEIRLDLEFINAQELQIISHVSRSVIYENKGLNNVYTKAPLWLTADDRVAEGFDVVLISRDGTREQRASKRFLPKVIRRLDINVPINWNAKDLSRTPKSVSIACEAGSIWSSQPVVINGAKGMLNLYFKLEIPVKNDSKESKPRDYTCSATSRLPTGNLLGHGTITGKLPHAYSQWPLSPVKLKASPLTLRF